MNNKLFVIILLFTVMIFTASTYFNYYVILPEEQFSNNEALLAFKNDGQEIEYEYDDSPSNEENNRKEAQRHTHQYVWNDGIDYNELCNAFHQRTLRNTQNSLIHDGWRGGLGHKMRSMRMSIVYSSLIGNRFYVDLPDNYWPCLDSCISDNRWSGEVDEEVTCHGSDKCFPSIGYKFNITQEMGMKDYRISDVRIPMDLLLHKENRLFLENIGLMLPNEESIDFERKINRLILNPSSDIREQINRSKHELFKRKHIIGLQVRTGGRLSVKPEVIEMVGEDTLPSIPVYIKSVMTRLRFLPSETTIFLSTDSDIASLRLREMLNDGYEVVESTAYSRGRSTGMNVAKDVVSNAIHDLFLLSQADALVITGCSSYGNLACSMSSSTICERIPVEKKTIKL